MSYIKYEFLFIFCAYLAAVNGQLRLTTKPMSLFEPGKVPKPGDIPVLNRKIFRGKRATALEFPYMASIRRNYVHYLCGVVINPKLILTIAHPIESVPIYELGIVLGQTYSDRGNSMHSVVVMHIHPDFDRYTLRADIAFLYIHDGPPYKATIKNLPIWTNLNVTGRTGFISGWGRCDTMGNELCLPRSSIYFPDEIIDPAMKSVKITVNLGVSCETYKLMLHHIPKGTLCVGEHRSANPVAPCMAVPGAPLVVEGALLGIQSWGYSCGYHSDQPIVYTSVPYFATWIIKSRKIFKMVDAANLMDNLYQATKSYILLKWLNASRPFVPITEYSEEDIQALDLDRGLAALSGTVYDIRDYIDNGRYRQMKQNIYEFLRAVIYRHAKNKPTTKTVIKSNNTDDPVYLFSDEYDEIKDFPRYNPPNIKVF